MRKVIRNLSRSVNLTRQQKTDRPPMTDLLNLALALLSVGFGAIGWPDNPLDLPPPAVN
jgi:hypothetical protein